jgi:hypothetical protein
METWEYVVLIVAFLLMAYFFMSSPELDFVVRGFNMDLYSKRPQYAPVQRPRYDPSLIVTETQPYPRSGQPFSYDQQTTSRTLTDDQYAQQQTLFDATGNGITPFQELPNWNDYMLGQSAGATSKTAVGAGATTPSWVPKTKPTRSNTNADARLGSGEQQNLAMNYGQASAVRAAAGQNSSGSVRHMSTMPLAENEGPYDSVLTDPNKAGEMSLETGLYGGRYAIDPTKDAGAPGSIVWTQQSAPQGILGGWRQQQTGATMSNGATWVGVGGPPQPIDSPGARAARYPQALPTGGIMELYADTNAYTRPGSVPIMADGAPLDINKKFVDNTGRVVTGVAYRAPEIDPRLNFLPDNHPQKLLDRHWHAAAIKNNLPPTERVKFVRRVMGDVARFRQIPWAFGGA